MAFCPNCGTPNTDQADKCVSCGHELSQKPKAKFKGTMMMAGIKVPPRDGPEPTADAGAPAAPTDGQRSQDAPAEKAPQQPPAMGDRRGAFQRTMVGHAGMVPPPSPPAPEAGGESSVAHAETVLGPGPAAGTTPARSSHVDPASSHTSDAFRAASPVTTGSVGSTARSVSGATMDSEFPGASPKKTSPGKLVAIGCAAVLVLTCVIAGLLWSLLESRLKGLFGGGDRSAEALAWHASIAQALSQVNGLCEDDCEQARVFFHPGASEAFDAAKKLSDERVRMLSEPASAKAEMLDETDDEEFATALGLDPQQCARVTAGSAKVVSCSVPEPDGKPSVLRIVHLHFGPGD